MFQNNFSKNNLKNISIKELYTLHLLFTSQKFGNNLTNLQNLCKNIFYINTLLNLDKNSLYKRNDIIFLNIFFFRKTKNTLSTFLKLQDKNILFAFNKRLLPAKSNVLAKKLVLKKFSIF